MDDTDEINNDMADGDDISIADGDDIAGDDDDIADDSDDDMADDAVIAEELVPADIFQAAVDSIEEGIEEWVIGEPSINGRLSNAMVGSLASALLDARPPNLRSVYLGGFLPANASNENLTALGLALSSLPSLDDLNLSDNGIGESNNNLGVLVKTLHEEGVFRKLKRLSVWGNRMKLGEDSPLLMITSAFQGADSRLESLFICDDESFGDAEAAVVAAALCENSVLGRKSTLKELTVPGSNLTVRGTEAFASALKKNCTLEKLHLYSGPDLPYDPADTSAIAARCGPIHAALEHSNYSLTELSDTNNDDVGEVTLGDESFRGLLRANRVEKEDFQRLKAVPVDDLPLSAWPLALARVDKKFDLLFQTLRSKPTLFGR